MIHNEIAQYIAEVNQIYKVSNATEHSYRPALKILLEALMPRHIATNEPKRIACGAPDYIIIGTYNSLALRQDVGALWESYLIDKRIKKDLNENTQKELYFWRTYDGQEIDLVEVSGDEISAFEFKWGDKMSNTPQAFATTYPQATYQVINRNNYLDYV